WLVFAVLTRILLTSWWAPYVSSYAGLMLAGLAAAAAVCWMKATAPNVVCRPGLFWLLAYITTTWLAAAGVAVYAAVKVSAPAAAAGVSEVSAVTFWSAGAATSSATPIVFRLRLTLS